MKKSKIHGESESSHISVKRKILLLTQNIQETSMWVKYNCMHHIHTIWLQEDRGSHKTSTYKPSSPSDSIGIHLTRQIFTPTY